MLEKMAKFFLKILLMVFALFGVRYILAIIGIVIPLEWFIIMVGGMLGFYGIIIIVVPLQLSYIINLKNHISI